MFNIHWKETRTNSFTSINKWSSSNTIKVKYNNIFFSSLYWTFSLMRRVPIPQKFLKYLKKSEIFTVTDDNLPALTGQFKPLVELPYY